MFTGIVTSVGRVRDVETPFDAQDLNLGASVACSGCCLTVVARNASGFSVTVSGETLAHTTLGAWKKGSPVNLERPLKIGDELGGHIVTGHVDTKAKLAAIKPEGESLRLSFEVDAKLMPFIAPKGSVALDGVSLTVNEVEGTRFGVNIIPHTSSVTTLGALKAGDSVNLEVDLLARYVARMARP